MTDNNIVKLTKVDKQEERTYSKCILEHLDSLTEEQKSARVGSMLLCALTEDGHRYSLLNGDDIASLMGLIELVKMCMFGNYMGDDYDV